MPECIIDFDSEREFHKLYDEKPKNLELVENALDLCLVARGNSLKISGKEENLIKCKEIFTLLAIGRDQGFVVKGADFLRFIKKVALGQTKELEELVSHPLVLKLEKLRLFLEI